MFELNHISGRIPAMKRLAILIACVASGHQSELAASATDLLPSENPYAGIASRNVFGLKPPPVASVAPDDSPPPSRIMPNGIMSIFGAAQVLFKTTSSDPTQPAQERTYILNLDQQQDGITVVEIDEKSRLITFNNHGVIQQIPLSPASIFTLPDSPPPVPGSSIRAMPKPLAGNPFGRQASQ